MSNTNYNVRPSIASGLSSKIGLAVKLAFAAGIASFGWQIVSAIAVIGA